MRADGIRPCPAEPAQFQRHRNVELEVFDSRASARQPLVLLICVLIAMLLAGQNAVAARHKHSRPEHASQRQAKHTERRVRGERQATAVRGARYRRRKSKSRARVPVVSHAQMELAQQMARNSYSLGQTLGARQRVALLSRLLYTMQPQVMASEKRQWAEELFAIAQRLPSVTNAASGSADGKSAEQMRAFRNGAIATAAARLALYDGDRALSLLDTLRSERGVREDARTMAARLVFATYMQSHGAAGAQTLLAHARQWGEHGGFPYGASTAALAKLSTNEDAAENFFRQTLSEFQRGEEGAFGVAEFGELLERAVAMEAISEEAAAEAGREVIRQAAKLAQDAEPGELATASTGGRELVGGANEDAADPDSAEVSDPKSQAPLSEEAQERLAQALNHVRAAAPAVYAQAAQSWPWLTHLQQVRMTSPVDGDLKIDPGLQASFGEIGEAIRLHSGPEQLRQLIAEGLQRVNDRYKAGMCSACDQPDRQSWALVSLAAYGSPFTIAAQLNAIEEPFWRAYFLAIAAQQVGEPTRVADPTARRVPVKEEAEPEEPDDSGPDPN